MMTSSLPYADFSRYLDNIPGYYIPLLRAALCKRYGSTGGNLIPNQIASQELRLNVGQLLRTLQMQSKAEADKWRGDMIKRHAAEAAASGAAGAGAGTGTTAGGSSAAAGGGAAEAVSKGSMHGSRNLKDILRGSSGGGGGSSAVGSEEADDVWWDHSKGSSANPGGVDDDNSKGGPAPKTAKAMEAVSV